MKKWLTSLIMILALAGGMLAGMPSHSDMDDSRMKAMKCCQKDNGESPKADVARLCCALVCANSAPTSSGFSSNFAPSAVAVGDSILKQIAALLAPKNNSSIVLIFSKPEIVPRKIPPKFIQYHSFLI